MTFLKYVLIFLGGIFIGFGVGTIIGNNLLATNVNYWAFSAGSLVLGGFLLALGLMMRNKKREEKREQQPKVEIPKNSGDSANKI